MLGARSLQHNPLKDLGWSIEAIASALGTTPRAARRSYIRGIKKVHGRKTRRRFVMPPLFLDSGSPDVLTERQKALLTLKGEFEWTFENLGSAFRMTAKDVRREYEDARGSRPK
jgi:hypothetical protein